MSEYSKAFEIALIIHPFIQSFCEWKQEMCDCMFNTKCVAKLSHNAQNARWAKRRERITNKRSTLKPFLIVLQSSSIVGLLKTNKYKYKYVHKFQRYIASDRVLMWCTVVLFHFEIVATSDLLFVCGMVWYGMTGELASYGMLCSFVFASRTE